MSSKAWCRIGRSLALSAFGIVSMTVPAQVLVPGFTKAFSPDTIAPGGLSTLIFTIDNSDSGSPAGDIQFTDTLPAAVSVASPASAGTTCSRGTVDATAGGGTIAFSGGGVEAFQTCTVFVNVTSSTPGTYTNISGDMTSDAGNSGSATDDLTVDASLPQFAKAFAPDTISPGGTSTLTFTIDNSANGAVIANLAFTDNLPAGVTVASPSNASTTCTGGTVTATSGTGVISYSGGSVAAGTSCTIEADVTSSAPGSHVNTTGNLTSDAGNSGSASDTLTVTQPPRPPILFKQFSPATIGAGGTSTVQLIIDHTSGTVAATSLSVTDNLPAAVTVASLANASTTCSGGTVTATPGTGVISYSGGSVAAGASCTIEADVTSSTPGTHVNTTGDLMSSLGNGGNATDTLTVTSSSVPSLSKSFSPGTIVAGGISTLQLVIDHTTGSMAATSLSVTDNLPAGVTVASPANASTTCTGGTVTATPGTGVISYSGGSVAAGTSCTIEADVTSSAPGSHVNTTGNLTSSLGTSGSATDTLTVTAVPVPTAGTWALIALALTLAMVGLWSLRGRLVIRS